MNALANTRPNEKFIENINNFIIRNADNLEKHYYSVIRRDDDRAANSDIYTYINSQDFNSELLKVSVVILTANYFESEILNYNVAIDNQIKIKKLDNGINIFNYGSFQVVDAFILTINNQTILHLHAPETGSNTPCGSADLVRYIEKNEYS